MQDRNDRSSEGKTANNYNPLHQPTVKTKEHQVDFVLKIKKAYKRIAALEAFLKQSEISDVVTWN